MNQLLQLYALNRRVAERRFEVRALADNEAEILLYDVIVNDAIEAEFWGGVAPEPFVKALRDITAQTIHLRINSPGGSVFAATTMKQALNEHPARIVVHVDGLAASAATDVMLAGDEVIMSPGAMLMIHNAWVLSMGNAVDLRKMADLLDKVDSSLILAYAKHTGKDTKTVTDWMAAETWFTATEAVDQGFASRVAEDGPKPKSQWDLSAYAHAPKAVQTPAPPAPAAPALASADHRERIQQRLRVAQALTPIE
jgi:ATP-dependent Clp protease protease subunit